MPCLFCKSDKTVPSIYEDTVFNNKVFSYLKCKNCKLIYLNPLPGKDDYEKMYPSKYQGEINAENEYVRDFDKVFGYYETYATGKKILDYGCGNGSYLNRMNKLGYDCTGVEFSEEVVSKMNENLKPMKFYTIEKFNADIDENEKYDIIHLANVIEHLENPVAVISKLKRHLNRDGIFMVYGPLEANFSVVFGFRNLVFGIRKYLLKSQVSHAPLHLFFSNRFNQKQFFERAGLKVDYFEVNDQMWPFPETYKEAKGFYGKNFFLLAKVSLMISRLYPKWGTTFYCVAS